MEFGTFFVQQVIIHQIPKVAKHAKDKSGPYLSEAPSRLAERHKVYFRERIVSSLKEQTFGIVHDDQSTSPVPQLLLECFKKDGSNFVAVSRDLALHLYDLQGGGSNAGLLALVEAVQGSGRKQGKCLVILKLEQDRSIQFKEAIVDGKVTFDIELQDITLAESTKVFKAALFTRTTKLAELAGEMSDNQRDARAYGPELAKFFVSDFLGCKQITTADRATKEFLESSEQWINEYVKDEEKKAEYFDALIVEIRSQKGLIDPKELAENHFDENDRDAFIRRFADEDGSVPTIVKETTLVDKRLKEMVYLLRNGVRLIGPTEVLKESTKFEDGRVVVESTLKDVGLGRGKPKARGTIKAPQDTPMPPDQ